MSQGTYEKKVFPLLRTALHSIMEHKVIMFPYCIIAFVQLCYLEILFFAPRYPLNQFFGPLINWRWGEKYLHYPYYFSILPRLFQNSLAQFCIYIFVSGFFIAVSMAIIANINSGRKFRFSAILKETLPSYVHIMVATAISLVLVYFTFMAYDKFLFLKLYSLNDVEGKMGVFKNIIIYGTPYFKLLLNILVVSMLAYVLPIIVIEKKSVFFAMKHNFKILKGSFWFTVFVVVFPTLLYVPILLLRSSMAVHSNIPEMSLIVLIVSALVMIVIDAYVYTAVTTFYLLKKEAQ